MPLYLNHLGYAARGTKRAVLEAPASFEPSAFEVRDPEDRLVHAGAVREAGAVPGWKGRRFWTLDFSALETRGRFFIDVKGATGTVRGEGFSIIGEVYDEGLVSDLVYGLKASRCSGQYDKADARAPVFGSGKRLDVRGAWYDASGDVSKYLTHLSYANYLNPQHIPLVVWSLLRSTESLARATELSPFLADRMVDEALHGADFLVRMQDGEGFFYQTLFDVWSKDVSARELCSYRTQAGVKEASYRAGYRQGGGMAVAALARAARTERAAWPASYAAGDYLAAAARGFSWLEAHGVECLPDGRENIIDDYCALLAASELFAASGEEGYREAAARRAERLIGRRSGSGPGAFWRADDSGERSFFHASDAGLPILALLAFAELTGASRVATAALDCARAALEAELAVTADVVNPFGYPRQFVKLPGEPGRSAFFIPHDNGTGYWWQGENARVASLASAALGGARAFSGDDAFRAALERYAASCLDWILGLNPFDACMLHGRGRNNPGYLRGYYNVPGAICNGVTSGFDDEDDVAFIPEAQKDDPMQNWRWGEQWLPHGAWFLYAVSQAMARGVEARG